MSDYSPEEEAEINIPFFPALVLFGVIGFLLLLLISDQSTGELTPQVAIEGTPTSAPAELTATVIPGGEQIAEATAETTPESAQVGDVPQYDPALVEQGRLAYQTTCSACHGPEARGIPGLGKDLLVSEFVDGLNDNELVHFITTGRPVWDPENTTGVDMPPRGGNPALTDEQIQAIAAYIRTESFELARGGVVEVSATEIPVEETPEDIVDESEPEDAAPVVEEVTPEASAPREEREFDPARAYAWSCSGCHGSDGQGVEGVAEGIVDSDLLSEENRGTLFDFLVEGNPLADPRIEFPHPPRGGYPPLTDEQLQGLIDYLFAIASG